MDPLVQPTGTRADLMDPLVQPTGSPADPYGSAGAPTAAPADAYMDFLSLPGRTQIYMEKQTPLKCRKPYIHIKNVGPRLAAEAPNRS